MENVRNRADIEILNGNDEGDEKKLLNRISKPNYGGAFIFENSQLVSVRMRPSSVCLNKPVLHGVSVLDCAKVPMYNWYYEYTKPKYGGNVMLGYTKFIPRTSSKTSEMIFPRCSTPVRIPRIIRPGCRE